MTPRTTSRSLQTANLRAAIKSTLREVVAAFQRAYVEDGPLAGDDERAGMVRIEAAA